VVEEETPEEPTTPNKPRRKFLWITLGLIIGLIILYVTWMDYSDQRQKEHDRFYRTINYPKSNLHNLYLGCKAYWAEAGSEQDCRMDIVTAVEYGFVQSEGVIIEGHGTESTFTATAHYPGPKFDFMDSTISYTVDAKGEVTQVRTKYR